GGANRVAARLNFDEAGMRSLIMKTARRIDESETDSWKRRLTAVDPRWEEIATWSTLKYASSPWTIGNYIKALDFKRDSDGTIVPQDKGEGLYIDVFIRTAWVSILVSLLCLVLAYPVAYLLANIPARYS